MRDVTPYSVVEITSTLKMDLKDSYLRTRRHVPEHRSLNSHISDDLTSDVFMYAHSLCGIVESTQNWVGPAACNKSITL
jgi:hypothetical protein